MRSSVFPILAAVGTAALAAAGWYFLSPSGAPAVAPAATTSSTPLPAQYTASGEHSYYKDDQYHYYFEVPAGLTTNDVFRSATGTEIVLTDASRKTQLSIDILPTSGGAKSLTAAQVSQISPDTTVLNATPVTPAPGCGGISFDSNSPDWGGASHEIWFLCRGNLYQLSAPSALATLLDAVFATWTFQ